MSEGDKAKAAILETMKSTCDECMEAYEKADISFRTRRFGKSCGRKATRLSLRDYDLDRTHRTVSKPSAAERDHLKVL